MEENPRPTDATKEVQFEIGHVLFIDIVGYSKLLLDEQKERLRQLTDIVLATPQVSESTNEQLVRLPTGDGMALVFRNSSEEPARCALEIAQALKVHPEVLVRMGIHSGPVSEVIDVNDRTNIAGAGINMAQRVMDCGDAGHILLSQRVADDLMHYRQWSTQLHDLGECEVKHGVRVHVVNLYTDMLGNPQVPQKFRERKAARATTLWRRPSQWCSSFWPSPGPFFIIGHIKASHSRTRTALFWRISQTRLAIPFLTAPCDKDSPRSSSRHRFSLWSQIRSSPRP